MTTDPAAGGPAPDPMAALVDIRNQVIRLGQEVAALRAEPAPGSDAINSVTAELREAVRFLAERLDGVARMVAQRGEELADTRGALGAIDAHVRSQAETIGVLTTGMQALPSYGQQVSALQDNLNALQQRLGTIDASIGQRLGGIEQAVARPTDAQVSERLSAIEGMLGPLAQRLAQAHNDHAASLQAVHSKLDSLASGTQAALSQPAVLDETALAALDPKLAALSSEISALRSDVAAVVTARSSSDAPSAPVDLAPLSKQIADLSSELESLRSDVAGVVTARGSSDAPAAPVDLSPVQQQLTELSGQLAALAAAPAAESGGAAAATDVDAAISGLESRIMAHVDDAVFALAQTLLGRAGAVALVDVPALSQPAGAPAAPAQQPAAGDEDYETDVDEGYLEDAPDVAPIDFSQADLDDEDADTVSWARPVDDAAGSDDTDVAADDAQRRARWAPAVAGNPSGAAPVAGIDAPLDQEAVWGAAPLPGEAPATVVPERRRRWFSW
ncbi:MAG TPA: hypothetical protein VG650_02875 [Mycobacteriales bacterium]|nr:hypothetical protein [Mycobacteriales bacterium]